jgi:hypothetical protein
MAIQTVGTDLGKTKQLAQLPYITAIETSTYFCSVTCHRWWTACRPSDLAPNSPEAKLKNQ